MAVVPPIIFAKTALDEVVAAFADSEGNAWRSTAEKLKLTEQATRRLQTACATGNLKMVVIHPRTGDRHEVPAQYFANWPMSELEFASALFRAGELSDQVGMLPLPEPISGGSIQALWRFLNVATDGDFALAMAWLLAA